jgi:hypothetical protein
MTEPARGARGFIPASWDSIRKYPKHRVFLIFHQTPNFNDKVEAANDQKNILLSNIKNLSWGLWRCVDGFLINRFEKIWQ